MQKHKAANSAKTVDSITESDMVRHYLKGQRYKQFEHSAYSRGSPLDPLVIDSHRTLRNTIITMSISAIIFSAAAMMLITGPSIHGMPVLDAVEQSLSGATGFTAFLLAAAAIGTLAVELAAGTGIRRNHDVSAGDRQHLMQEAEHWIGLGKYKNAIAAYDRILSETPADPKALLNKGYVYDELGQYDQAIAAYDALIKAKPKNAKALYNKGITLLEKDRMPDAFRCFQEALKINKNDLPALRKICFILFSKKNYRETIKFCNKVLSFDSNNIDILIMKGKALEHLGKTKEALWCYESALKVDPKDAWAFECKASLTARKSDNGTHKRK
ncbi:tetratricopeptide repeat protein [Candidatus Woesearchaeota archaeon]|nr:tetratricopeptide repeat protein [Candidatus Woesearchaeota archaeon]